MAISAKTFTASEGLLSNYLSSAPLYWQLVVNCSDSSENLSIAVAIFNAMFNNERRQGSAHHAFLRLVL